LKAAAPHLKFDDTGSASLLSVCPAATLSRHLETVSTRKQLELIASNLDDMSVTLEEIKEHVQGGNPLAVGILERLGADM
jgi:hypothetical protein